MLSESSIGFRVGCVACKVYIYDYGKLDMVSRLKVGDSMALIYDPACTMCALTRP